MSLTPSGSILMTCNLEASIRSLSSLVPAEGKFALSYSQVRGACVLSESTIATGSRDKSVRVWVTEDSGGFALSKTLIGHTSFVGPVAWIPPCAQYATGALVSGGMDTKGIVWDLDKVAPIAELAGHTYQVRQERQAGRTWHAASLFK
jgi:WD40 repeat protein